MKLSPEYEETCKFLDIDPIELLNSFQSRVVDFAHDGTKNRIDAHMSRLFPVYAFKNEHMLIKVDD